VVDRDWNGWIAFFLRAAEEQAAIPKVSGAKILKNLEENNIIRVLQRGAGRRASMYAFPRLLAITEGDRL